MYYLTLDQKIENLKEQEELAVRKIENLNKQLDGIRRKIQKFEKLKALELQNNLQNNTSYSVDPTSQTTQFF